MFVSITLII